MKPRKTVLCTVGASLSRHVRAGAGGGDAAAAWDLGDWGAVASILNARDPKDPSLGAELGCIHRLTASGLARPAAEVLLYPSQTDLGRETAAILSACLSGRGHPCAVRIAKHLRVDTPALLEARGLGNLARLLARDVRDRGVSACAISASGGYKAQIAVAAVVGQMLRVPVFYRHEGSPEVARFPSLESALRVLRVPAPGRVSAAQSSMERSD